MGTIVAKFSKIFTQADPSSYSKFYCDPVGWSKSIGMLIPPIMDGEYSMSGLQSSFTQLMDALIGRYEYNGELGSLALAEMPWLPSLHAEFFRRLASHSIRAYVKGTEN